MIVKQYFTSQVKYSYIKLICQIIFYRARMSQSDNYNILKERGSRLKWLRTQLGIKQEDFAKKLGISRATLSYWENASTVKFGLHEEAAKKVVNIISELGTSCNLTWLLYGIGDAPFTVKNMLDEKREINLFLLSSENAVATEMFDNSMQPIFSKGDMVGGIWKNINMLKTYDDFYIIEIEGKNQVRKIRRNDIDNTFDVFSICYSNDSKLPFEIKNLQIEKIAPIIRFWRKN